MHLRPVLLSVFILLSGFNMQGNKQVLAKWAVTNECTLTVKGTTNINSFGCVIPDFKGSDTLVLYKENGSAPIIMTGSLALDVNSFDCHNHGMTGELRKTLKAKEFPNLVIRFISLSKYPDHAEAIKGQVEIELAGISKKFDVDYKFTTDGVHQLTLIGTRKVNFSDFNIIPPRKLGGMIKTNNELSVEFDLKVKVL